MCKDNYDNNSTLRAVKIDSEIVDNEYQKCIEQTKKSLLLIKELEERRLAMHEFVDSESRKK